MPVAKLAIISSLIALVLPGTATSATVRSGPLSAAVGEGRWSIDLSDRDGPILGEHPGQGAGPLGRLGFETAAGWAHATRVASLDREGRALVATLETTDPLGRRMRATVSADRAGVIELRASVIGQTADVRALGIGFGADSAERFVGFGERSNAVDQRGSVVESYVGEGAYPPAERGVIAAFVPPWGFQQRDDATYFPVPWLLSGEGYGVLVDNTETSYFRLGTENAGGWSVEVTNAPPEQPQGALAPAPEEIVLRVFAGPRPADVLRRFTAATGRQPRAAAPWYFGPWFQPSGNDAEQIETLQAADAPISVAQTYTHYLPCGDHLGNRDRERQRTGFLHSEGLAATTYFNPMLCSAYEGAYDEAAAAGALTANAAGTPYVYRYSTDTQFFVSQFDFSADAGRSTFQGLLGEAVEDGYDGWMEDFGEYTPLDSRSANGMDGTEMHNLYPVQYHCAAQEFADGVDRQLGRFIRSGYTGVAPCAQIVWGGDPTTTFGFDGLQSSVTNALTMGLSGISVWGSDVGGFFALGNTSLSDELLQRWVQFGAVSGVMRTQANGIAVPPKERPQIWDADQIGNWRRYAKLRTQLYPYIAAADREYGRSGLPIMRHLMLAYPDDERAAASDDEFLFGPDLLAAPVLEAGATSRALYLPRGRWVDLWRSVDYDEAGEGGLDLAETRMLRGAREVTLPAPIEELPMLARAGAVLTLLPPAVDTLSPYGDTGAGAEVVHLADRKRRLELLAFPRGKSAARFYNGGRLLSRERDDRWNLAVRSRKRYRFGLQASLATLKHELRPCRVTLDGGRLPGRDWSFDRGTRVLTASFAAKRALLSIRGCG